LPPTEAACIPEESWVPYVVQSGDTLFELARATGFSTAAVQAGNCISSNDLIAGQTILLPPSSPVVQAPSVVPPTVPGCSNPAVQIRFPAPGNVLRTPLIVRGVANDEFFGFYRLWLSPNPETFFPVGESSQRETDERALGTLNVPQYPPGSYNLVLEVFNQFGSLVERCVVPVGLQPN